MIDRLGRFSAVLTLLMAMLAFIIVVLRYVFNMGWVSLQELVIYMHAAAFLLAAPYTLKNDGHVRVDVLFERMNEKQRKYVQMASLLLVYFPLFITLFYFCWPYVLDSWKAGESSADAGGLPALYLLKSLLLVFPALMIYQGLKWFRGLL